MMVRLSQKLPSPMNTVNLRIELLQIRYKLHADFKRVHGTKHENGKILQGPKPQYGARSSEIYGNSKVFGETTL
jgi:hypothetical protein